MINYFQRSLSLLVPIFRQFLSSPLSILNKRTNLCGLELLLQVILERNSISSEFADTLTQLLNSHGILVEVESEVGFVVNVGLLWEVQALSVCGIELLRNGFGGGLQLFEEVGLYADSLVPTQSLVTSVEQNTYSNCKVIATSQLRDLPNASE